MATTSIRPDQVVIDPASGFLAPTTSEAALAAQLPRNSLAAPFAAGLEMRRMASGQRFADMTQQNNALRQAMAKNLADREFAQARFNTTASNLDQIAGAGGRDFAVAMLGQQPTGFSSAATAVDLAGLQADAAKTASDAALAGARAGVLPRASQDFQDVTGFQVEDVVPLGIAEAQADNLVTQRIYDPGTNSFYDIKLPPEMLPAHIRERTAAAAAGDITGDTVVPQDTAQAQAVDNIKRNVARDGGEFLSPPRQVVTPDGDRAIEYHVRLSDGSTLYYYAFENDPTVRGSETSVGAGSE